MTAPKLNDLLLVLAKIADNAEAFLDETRKGINSAKPADIARDYLAMKESYDSLKALTTRINNVVEAFNKGLFPQVMEANDLDLLRIPELGRSFSVLNKMSASIIDKEKGYAWLRERGSGDLIQETVNAGTLASYLRSLILDEGIEPPVDIFKVSPYKATSINKYTPKKGVE